MSFTTIEEYNNYLVQNKTDVDIIEYVKEINKLTFNIDISFIDDFIKLVDTDTCCIHHSMLKKYEVSNLTAGSSHVIRLMQQNGFINKKDYLLTKVGEQIFSGTKYKNEYYLHPDTFKICLIRSQNTQIYARYFLLLEKAVKYYRDYQIIIKNIKIDKLKNKNHELTNMINISKKNHEEQMKQQMENHKNQMEEQRKDREEQKKNYEKYMNFQQEDRIEQRKKYTEQIKKSDEILKNNINITEKLDNITEELVETKDELVETKEILEDTNNNVRLIAKKLDIAVEDRVRRSNQSSTIEYLIILKSNIDINNYYIIRGQKRHIKVKIDLLKEYHKIKSIKCVPYTITLF